MGIFWEAAFNAALSALVSKEYHDSPSSRERLVRRAGEIATAAEAERDRLTRLLLEDTSYRG